MSAPLCSIYGVRHHSLNMNANKGSEGGKRKFHQPNETPKTPKEGHQLRVERRVVCTCRKKRSVKEKRKVTTTTSSN